MATAATQLSPRDLIMLEDRFRVFEGELRTHSTVEDALMFPAIEARGGVVEEAFAKEHRQEQLLVYDVACAFLALRLDNTGHAGERLVQALARVRASLGAHLQAEEDEVLSQVSNLFDENEQAALLQKIFSVLPPDPRLQPWVAAALTPEHREARLRNMQAALPPAALVATLRQIREGVTAEVWTDISRRLPELASLTDTPQRRILSQSLRRAKLAASTRATDEHD